MPDFVPPATLAEQFRALLDVVIQRVREEPEEYPHATVAPLLASHAALEQRVKELEEDLANATGGFDAAMGLADAEQERAKAAEQRVRDLEAAERHYRAEVVRLCLSVTHEGPNATKRIMDRAIAARTHKPKGGCYCDECSGSAQRGTGEGNRG